MPGTISHSMPAWRTASSSSPPRPKMKGSPPLKRTTLSPSNPYSTSSRFISCWLMLGRPPRLPTLITLADDRISAEILALTSSSCRTTSADFKVFNAFSVSSSGSPGPAPTRYTFPFIARSPFELSSLQDVTDCPQLFRAKCDGARPDPFRAQTDVYELSRAAAANLRTRDQNHSQIGGADAGPTQDYGRRSKLRFADRPCAPRLDSRSRRTRDHPQHCKECFAPALPQTPAGSHRVTKLQRSRETCSPDRTAGICAAPSG